MALFHHHSGAESEYITRFHISHGDYEATLAWDQRDDRERAIMVFRSTQGFVEEGVEPTDDGRQELVYRGADRHVKLTDHNLASDVVYYYSVFAQGDDGEWHLQLTDTVSPGGAPHHWSRGPAGDADSLQEVIDSESVMGG
jgi:hypothetical protein